MRNSKHLPALFAILVASWMPTLAHGGSPVKSYRVLFVGNSITYTNNLPAVFAELLSEIRPSLAVRADMLAEGGASLADWKNDTRVMSAIQQSNYDVVVLQEQGGRISCAADVASRSDQSCLESIDSHRELARRVRGSGARLLYLGTYQPDADFSKELVEAERWISREIDAEYVEVSESLRDVAAKAPSEEWFDVDGMHPGPLLTAFLAVKTFQGLGIAELRDVVLCVRAPDYRPSGKFPDLVTYRPVGDDGDAPCLRAGSRVRDVARWIR
jgi:hypothetical protein